MSFISLDFVLLFSFTFILYHTVVPKYKKAILLAASFFFYRVPSHCFPVYSPFYLIRHFLARQMDRSD